MTGFSIPYFLSYFLQNLYGLADLFITGQYNGADVITAVSNGSQIMHMVTLIVVGLSVGTTVMTAHAVGAGDKRSMRKAIGNSITIFAVFALAVTVMLFMLAKPVTLIMQTPPESQQEMIRYLTICFAGIPLITAYNVIASIFRGMGDSRTPMIFVFIACVFNIVLDFILIGAFGMGASGAAIATIAAQGISVLLSVIMIIRRDTGIKLEKKDLIVDKNTMSGLVKIGLPIAVQDALIQVSFLVITAIANSRGVEIAAAVGIVEKIITFIFLVPSSMLSTISTMGAQFIGAEKYGKARKVLYMGCGIAVSIGLVIFITFQFVSEGVVSLFTRDTDVIRYGTQYLTAYVIDCVVASVHFSFSGYFSAIGLSVVSFIHNVCSIVIIRIPGFYLMSRLFPEDLHPWGLVAPCGGVLSCLICLGVFFWIKTHSKYGGNDV